MGKKGENIYKRKDGRWEARYVKGYKPDGEIRYGYCYGKTYREAKDKAIQAKSSVINHLPIRKEIKKKRFSLYCDEWILLKRSCVKESTFIKYFTTIEKYIKPRLGGCYAEAFTETLIEQFSYDLLHEVKLSPKTVKDILTMVRSIVNYMKKKNPSVESVEIVYPKENKKEMRVLSREEQMRFVEYLLNDMDVCKFGILLALMTGLRIGEICALCWSDISLNNQTIHVCRTMQRIKNITDDPTQKRTKVIVGEPKSSKSVRTIPLNDNIAEFCRRWKAEKNKAIVLTGEEKRFMEPRTLQYRLNKYTGDCGLEGVHFHTLRHSFATRCVEAGFEIKSLSEILGHSSPKVTLERYVHSSLELKRENMEKLKAHYIFSPSETAVKS